MPPGQGSQQIFCVLQFSNECETTETWNDVPHMREKYIEQGAVMHSSPHGNTWSRLKTKPEVFNFYIKNLDEFGWKEQTTIRGETSVLNYVGDNNRVAILTIREIMFGNSEVMISVAPYTEEFEEAVGEYINEKYLEITDWKEN